MRQPEVAQLPESGCPAEVGAGGSALDGWPWDTAHNRRDAIVLMSCDACRPFRAGGAGLGDPAYNSHAGGVQQERRACALTVGCDAGQWFGHVELHCLKSRQALHGGRPACDIDREDARNVLLVRSAKYLRAWAALGACWVSAAGGLVTGGACGGPAPSCWPCCWRRLAVWASTGGLPRTIATLCVRL